MAKLGRGVQRTAGKAAVHYGGGAEAVRAVRRGGAKCPLHQGKSGEPCRRAWGKRGRGGRAGQRETPWAALPENPPAGAGAMLLAGQRRSMAQATPGGEPPAGPEQGVPGFALEGVDPAYRDAVYAGQALAELLRPERRKAGTETGKALQPGGGYGTLRAEENGEGLAAIGQNGVSDLTQAVDGGEKQQSGGTEKNGTPPPEAWIDKPPQPDGWMDTQHTDGQRGKIQYYGQEYQGTWKNGELYLDKQANICFWCKPV